MQIGIIMHFEHDTLKDLLMKQIERNNKEAARLETELPNCEARLLDLEKQQEQDSLKHVMEFLRSQNECLAFYAGHLPPGSTELSLQDVRMLGFIEYEQGWRPSHLRR